MQIAISCARYILVLIWFHEYWHVCSTQSPHDFAIALGEAHVKQKFPDERSLSRAISHAWYLVGDSNLKSQNKDRSYEFVACADYSATAIESIQTLSDQSSTLDFTYSTVADNRLCFVLQANYDEIEGILRSPALSLVAPVPSVLKFDLSLHHLLDLTHQPNHIPVDQMNFGPLSAAYKRIAENKYIALSVLFRSGTNREQLQQRVESWRHQMVSQEFEPSRLWDEFYWTSNYDDSVDKLRHSSLERTQSVKGYSSSDFSRDVLQSSVNTFATASADDTSRPAMSMSHLQRQEYWRKRQLTVDRLRREDLLGQHCGWRLPHHELEVTYRRDNIIMKLPTQTVEDLLESDKLEEGVRGSCLALLSAVLAIDPSVIRIGLTLPMRTQNNYARGILQSGSAGSEPFSAAGLNGTGIILGVADTGIDMLHCSFRDLVHGATPPCDAERPKVDLKYRKVVQYVNFSGSTGDTSSGHGSHVSGSLAGYCLPNDPQGQSGGNLYSGMAPAAKLAFFDIGVYQPVGDLVVPEDFGNYLYPPNYYAGARLISNSWGGVAWYDAFAIETDGYLYNHDDVIIVYAAGNDGYSGFGTVLSPALSKNAVAIAASETGHNPSQNINRVAAFSAIGPAPDGRVKPDITAPGYSIVSSISGGEPSVRQTCGFGGKAGTSMATPTAGGTAGLVQQFFRDPKFWARLCDSRYHLCRGGAFHPKGTLVKALLLQSGDTMSLSGGQYAPHGLHSTPDIFQGYGRINLHNILTLQPASTAAFALYVDQAQLPSFSEIQYRVTVRDNSVPLRVTISWYDPPNQVFAAKVLLHDLDLLLVDPGGRAYYGNAPLNSTSGNPSMGSARDELNTNEQVIIRGSSLMAGTWRVHVQSKLLTQAELQNYSIAITVNGFVSETYPHSPAPLAPAFFQRCAMAATVSSGPSSPVVDVDLSLWSMYQRNGWGSQDSYTIRGLTSGLPEDFLPSTISPYQGTFSTQFDYARASACLPAASCYSTDLTLHTPAHSGTQFSIPQCDGTFLAPLHTSHSFCLENTTDAVVSPPACSSICSYGERVEIYMVLAEEQGEGWYGAYYTVQDFSGPSVVSLAAGTLEWDFDKLDSLCLPWQQPDPATAAASAAAATGHCYTMFLSTTGAEYYPYLHFYHSTLMLPDDNADGRYITTSTPCPHYLMDNVTVANVCISGDASSGNVTFYSMDDATLGNMIGFGQKPVAPAALKNALDAAQLYEAGVCSMPVHYSAEGQQAPLEVTAQPTLTPSKKPTRAPTAAMSDLPTKRPTSRPTRPTRRPTPFPTNEPSQDPTNEPTERPSDYPSRKPTLSPTARPNRETDAPTDYPSNAPSLHPSAIPLPASPLVASPTCSPQHTKTPSRMLVTAEPTLLPVIQQSASPTAPIDTAPFFSGHDYSCFSTCPDFPGNVLFAENAGIACDFLAVVPFPLCDSFSIAFGSCPVQACSASCSAVDWCYFAAGSVINCPSDSWDGEGQAATEMANQCVKHFKPYNSTLKVNVTQAAPPADSSASSGTNNESTILGATLTLAAILILCGCVQYYRSEKQQEQQRKQHQKLSAAFDDSVFVIASEEDQIEISGGDDDDGSGSSNSNSRRRIPFSNPFSTRKTGKSAVGGVRNSMHSSSADEPGFEDDDEVEVTLSPMRHGGPNRGGGGGGGGMKSTAVRSASEASSDLDESANGIGADGESVRLGGGGSVSKSRFLGSPQKGKYEMIGFNEGDV